MMRQLSCGVVLAGLVGGAACSDSIEQLSSARNRANEASAVGSIRALISGEIAYSVTTGGFGTPECLSSPKSCVPDDPGQPYITQGLLSGGRSGYTFEFIAGPEESRPGRAAGSTLTSFAVVATPAVEGTGARIYCGDSTGSVCVMPEHAEATGGACPASCKPVQ